MSSICAVTAQARVLSVVQNFLKQVAVLLLLSRRVDQTRVGRRVFRLEILDRLKVGRVGDDLGEFLQLLELIQLRLLLVSDSGAHDFFILREDRALLLDASSA